jgi:hypothetical protein
VDHRPPDSPHRDTLGRPFLLGWGILRVVALIPVVAGLIWFAAVVFGLGALTVTIWRARSTSQAAPAPA